MDKIYGFNLAQFIAIVTVFATILSSSITIIVTKLFENYQNSKKHQRVIIEKVLDTKINTCKSAITYYGTYLNYLYSIKYTFESLENYDYSQLMSKSQKLSEEILKKIQIETNNEHLQILLFYDLYGNDDEKIADEMMISIKNYYQFVQNHQNMNFDINNEFTLRKEVNNSIKNAINYFKQKIELVRNDMKGYLD